MLPWWQCSSAGSFVRTAPLVTRPVSRLQVGSAARVRKPARRFALDRRRAMIAVCSFAAVLAFGAAVSRTLLPLPSAQPSRATGQGRGAELATGPIIFIPRSGNDCRQKLIDNATWRIRDNGTVDCDVALGSRPDEPPREGAP